MPEQAPEILILAVDDEELNNEMIERAFRGKKNCRVIGASSGAEALELLAKEPVDIMLVDHSMPRMNGVQFLEQAMRIVPDAVSVMVTGFPELKEVVEARHRGLVRHLVAKPWKTEDLVQAVDRALQMREMRRAVGKLKDPG